MTGYDPPVAHPVFEALLKAYCEVHLMDYAGVLACIELGEMPPRHIVEALSDDLGVPRAAWSGEPLVKSDNVVKTKTVTHAEARAVNARKAGHANRRPTTPAAARIYAWMDGSAYPSVRLLADAVSARIGRRISRSSMRNYIDGTQQMTRKKMVDGKSVTLGPIVVAASVPADVRKAVEDLSGGVIPADSWSKSR